MNENNNTQQENISRVLLVGVNVDDNPDFEMWLRQQLQLLFPYLRRNTYIHHQYMILSFHQLDAVHKSNDYNGSYGKNYQ